MSRIEKALKRMGNVSQRNGEQKQKPSAPPNALAEETAKGKMKIPSPTRLHHLDMDVLAKMGFLVPQATQSTLAEECRALKRPLLINAFGNGEGGVENANIIMITSALPGDGKTFITINLGMSMAMEMDTTVLLVDGDVVRPALTQAMGLEDAPGLIDVLDGKMALKDVIVRTDVPKLWVLPAGQAHGQSAELLASGRMREISKELAARYSDRVVLFDSPPVLATSHAGAISRLAGQILMVVEAGKTPQSAIKEAVSHFDSGKIIGMALNKSPQPARGSYYGGLYGAYGQ
jgi:protein-tyrosine kinase